MGARIALSGNFAANSLFSLPPALVGETVLWSFFGNGAADNQNLVPGQPSFSNVGAGPTYSTGYMTCVSGTTGIDTNIIDGSFMQPSTIIVAARSSLTNAVTVSSFSTAGGNSGFQLEINQVGTSNVIHGYAAPGGAPQANVTTAFDDPTQFHLLALRIPVLGSPLVANNLSQGIQVSGGNAPSYLPANSNGHIFVGTDPSTTTNHAVDIAFAGIIGGDYLSDTDLNIQVASLRAILALRGITV